MLDLCLGLGAPHPHQVGHVPGGPGVLDLCLGLGAPHPHQVGHVPGGGGVLDLCLPGSTSSSSGLGWLERGFQLLCRFSEDDLIISFYL